MTDIPLERSLPIRHAETALLEQLDRLGLDHHIEVAGELVHTARCTISDGKTGQRLASGNGKGDLIASRVGSLFEATEHLFSQYQFIDPARLLYRDTSEFCRNNPMCDRLPLVLLKSSESTEIPFVRHTAVHGSQTCLYPLALMCPGYIDLQLEHGDLRRADSFDYSRLEHYSTNSGTAIGINAEEAIIHGLLEGIERTSLSQFLVDTFVRSRREHLRMVDTLTLPAAIRDVAQRFEQETSSNVRVFEMPNKFGVPAYVSWMEQDEFRIGIAGYGCSLSVEHAILRSLHEVSQYVLLTRHIFGLDWLRSKCDAICTQLEGLPLHQDCAVFDLGWKCRTLGYEAVAFQDLPRVEFATSPTEYLRQLTDRIYASGEVPYASELRILGNAINVTHTFITGEDRFFNVQNCKSTFPATVDVLTG